MNSQFGSESKHLTCPHCRSNINTRIETYVSTKTHCVALLLCLLLCWPCVAYVYYSDKCRLKRHYCPNCGKFLGQHDIQSCI